MTRICTKCRKVEVDEDDNTITYMDGENKVTGKVCPNCYFNTVEVKE